VTTGNPIAEGDYSEIADEQLDELEHADGSLYNDILTVCEQIFLNPARARSMSAAITTPDGIVFRVAVPGRAPYKVFWSSDGPRIEAVFPYPT
jgi:hypothetical protein